jgi:hypothetical protein
MEFFHGLVRFISARGSRQTYDLGRVVMKERFSTDEPSAADAWRTPQPQALECADFVRAFGRRLVAVAWQWDLTFLARPLIAACFIDKSPKRLKAVTSHRTPIIAACSRTDTDFNF